jgi:hypothetical protein
MLKKVLLPLGVLAATSMATGQVVLINQSPLPVPNPITEANSGAISTNGGANVLADNFTVASVGGVSVSAVQFWGFMAFNAGANVDDCSAVTSFEITFYEDSAGLPGALVGGISSTVFPNAPSDFADCFDCVVGDPLPGFFCSPSHQPGPFIDMTHDPNTYQFDATLPSSVVLPQGDYWISIAVNRMAPDTQFNWTATTDPPSGDDIAVRPGVGGAWAPSLNGAGDRAFVLIGTVIDAGIDSDVDGLLDSTELELVGTFMCLDPFNPDSDGDGLEDGEELVGEVMVSNPCLVDSDGDGLNDAVDPAPLDPGEPQSEIESAIRTVVTFAADMPLDDFDANNANSAGGKRGAIANKLNSAANAVADGDYAAALDILTDLAAKIDGDPAVKDWMSVESEARQTLYEDVQAQIDIILTLL